MNIPIQKLGSSSSDIFFLNGTYKKLIKLKNKSEYELIVKGIKILKKNFNENIQMPISINYKVIDNCPHIIYKQDSLEPWINPEWITGLQLYSLAIIILKQQEKLIEHGLCFVDARPENYWLASKNSRLVDLAGIKILNNQNLLSFEVDFKKHFLNPLELEKKINLPVSSYFKGNLQEVNFNFWGLKNNLTNIRILIELIRTTLINYLSYKISSSSPDFIKFLNSNQADTKDIISSQKAQKKIKRFFKLIDYFKPHSKIKGNWTNYNNFHDHNYNQNKLDNIKLFVDKYSPFTKIVDIGSNITTLGIKNIKIRIDNDLNICRTMRQEGDQNSIVLQVDVASALCNRSLPLFKSVNCMGFAKSAIMTGIIHHLIIDYGLSINIFYRNLSILFDSILLEFPIETDPMVQLLIRKKNELIEWNWEKNHLPICQKYFLVSEKVKLSKSRFLVELNKK